ncbi:hypothetical protein HRG_010460 [Hirsutella rhossiliensis]|uniref:Uncharacterized protein n=1 Tax=Hirsutella rhossiliensis TaxID=111463 RepID=A0A9P8SDI1_9HYPO|nr:uncharacterized protein HRG_10460 [Hirsutella rhossiliensis]KAH0958773.1 hypothetical protein HRG_10460 [Hirsutella rhossiliensis]
MKYRTAAAIAMCLTNGAIAAPTQSNEQGMSMYKHTNQLAKDMERRDRTAELSEMIQNALVVADEESRQKRDDIEQGAAKALSQTGKFTQMGSEEEGADAESLWKMPSRRSMARKHRHKPKHPLHARLEDEEEATAEKRQEKAGEKKPEEPKPEAGKKGEEPKPDAGKKEAKEHKEEAKEHKEEAKERKEEAKEHKEEAGEHKEKPGHKEKSEHKGGKGEKPGHSKADKEKKLKKLLKNKGLLNKDGELKFDKFGKDHKEKKKLLEKILKKSGLLKTTSKLKLDKVLNKLKVSKLTGKLKVNELTDALGAGELTDSLGVTGGKHHGKSPGHSNKFNL